MNRSINSPARAAEFPTAFPEIQRRVDSYNPLNYRNTRNYGNGEVSALSPYISRGVISTRFVLNSLLKRGFALSELLPFIQQMAWREYFQRVWQSRGDELDADLNQPSPRARRDGIPSALIHARTGIRAIDEMVVQLTDTGYLHNHYRLYLAALACNAGQSDWKLPARWMYFHLLDADWASNACSWQWVAGSFSRKIYFANQENINRFSGLVQHHTFLDCPYEELEVMALPEVLVECEVPDLWTTLPSSECGLLNPAKTTFIYTFHSLDPLWHADDSGQRVLILEPSWFHRYPVCSRTMEFVVRLSRNIPGIRIFCGEWDEFLEHCKPGLTIFREHPSTAHFTGYREDREWLFPDLKGYYPSFFRYWKEAEKHIHELVYQTE